MPAITITAINTGTEEFTATAHGLLTGDRFRLRNVGGALPAATPSLAAVTDYFAIVTGANTLKVAVSSANALAGTAVNLTGSLTGTTTIEYGLPFCIPTALAAQGTQAKSTDANATWNALVAIYGLLTAQAESIWSGNVSLAGGLTVGGNLTVTGAIKNGPHTYHVPLVPFALSGLIWLPTLTASPLGLSLRSSASGASFVWIPTITGLTIQSVTFALRSEAGTEDLTDAIVRKMFKNDTAAASIGSTGVLSNVSTSWSDVSINVTDTLIDDTFDLAIFFDGNAAGLHVKNIRAVMAVV